MTLAAARADAGLFNWEKSLPAALGKTRSFPPLFLHCRASKTAAILQNKHVQNSHAKSRTLTPSKRDMLFAHLQSKRGEFTRVRM